MSLKELADKLVEYAEGHDMTSAEIEGGPISAGDKTAWNTVEGYIGKFPDKFDGDRYFKVLRMAADIVRDKEHQKIQDNIKDQLTGLNRLWLKENYPDHVFERVTEKKKPCIMIWPEGKP